MNSVPFKDREQAAWLLLDRLKTIVPNEGIVVALPRGSVPMAKIIADALKWPLRVLLIKKMGHPINPEYAIGVVTKDGYKVEDSREVSEAYIKGEVARLQNQLAERELLYGRSHCDIAVVRNKCALLIDDGIATGRSMSDAIRLLLLSGAAEIIVAVPISAKPAAGIIARQADRFIALEVPEEFYGVGQAFESFPQIEDEEVVGCLQD